ncbi:hypothetical protein H072_2660 [Dactylellina haptotyla CBS 200.50]|uniref:PQ loop repeat protein n=1 Tax=Dactylellina haptotyla (strain CBS 200.50) TaxID=1284197 RepID=S8AKC3_DACHA|nr:hypothetical protein H072_2660 [Dactylellina haptotyla CBS 200.50]
MVLSVSPFSQMPATDCSAPLLANPSYSNFGVSVLLLLGILVSYLPQHHRIITRQTSEGISPLFLLLGVTSGTCALANIWMLGWGVVECCSSDLGPFQCLAGMLGILQVTTHLLLFLIYFPLATPVLPTSDNLSTDSHHHKNPSPTTAITISILSLLHLVAILAVSVYLYRTASPTTILNWTSFLGIQSTILASIQYIPQIYTTYKLQAIGSLSIPMMCIQTPGSFVWAFSLASREGTDWSSWLVYCVTGVLQGSLLVMAIIFERRRKRDEADAALFVDRMDDDDSFVHEADNTVWRERRPANERTRLLADEDDADL